ncbi:MAG: polysaccharide deacetylase family protein [Tepidisphaeraceae bacterium]
MIGRIQHLVRRADATVARAYLAMFRERGAVMSFLFHSLFRDEREIARNLLDPLQRTTIAQFRQFVEYYVGHGYSFITPADLLAGLPRDGRYAMITFDDGYFNNTLALPILEQYGVPATFFISTNHVRQNKSYWWDVLYRERIAQGATPDDVYHEALAHKGMRTEDIEATLLERFGADALTPRTDIDRPFTPAELRDFAHHPRVHIGNHTANHAILTNYSAAEARAQLEEAQRALRDMTGTTPIAVAYPNGGHDDAVVAIARDVGLKVGVTVRPAKNVLRPDSDLLRLGRFCPDGDVPMRTQCQTFRSDVLVYGLFRDCYLRFGRGQVAQ